MRSEDLYAVLGVTPDASVEQIRRTYRRLALQLHPDHNPGDASAAERFKELSAAAAVLTDPARRAAYDRRLLSARAVGMGTWAEHGYDVCYTLHISAGEARAGCTRSLHFHGPDGGSYEIPVVVPPGARSGERVYVRGAGGPSRDGRARGDLIAEIQIIPGEHTPEPDPAPACAAHLSQAAAAPLSAGLLLAVPLVALVVLLISVLLAAL